MAKLTDDQRALVEANIGLAYHYADKFARLLGIESRSADHDDFRSDCVLVLVGAASRHDPARGSFSTYASVCIRRGLFTLARVRCAMGFSGVAHSPERPTPRFVYRSQDADNLDERDQFEAHFCDTSVPPVGSELEAEDYLKSLLSTLPEPDRELVHAYYFSPAALGTGRSAVPSAQHLAERFGYQSRNRTARRLKSAMNVLRWEHDGIPDPQSETAERNVRELVALVDAEHPEWPSQYVAAECGCSGTLVKKYRRARKTTKVLEKCCAEAP